MTELRLTNNDGQTYAMPLQQGEAIKLNFRFDDIENFANTGNFTRDFRIPINAQVIQFFGDIANVTHVGWFDFRKKVGATITVDSIPISTGHVQVKQVINKKELVLTFFGDIPNIARAIGEKKLKDIAALADLNYTLSDANFSDPNANTILALVDKYRMTAVNSMGGLAITDTQYPCYIGHMTPAVKAAYIFDKIVTEAGFYWDKTEMDAALDNVYVPFVNSQFLQTDQGFNNAYFNLGITSNQTGINADYVIGSIAEFADNGSNCASGIFTVPYFGQYTFRYWANVTRTAGSGNTSIRFILRDVDTGQVYSFSTSNIVFASNQTIHREETGSWQFTAGTRLRLEIQEVVNG